MPLTRKIRLVRDVERYPDFIARKGMTGEIDEISKGFISVQIDDHLEGAEAWNNRILWTGDFLNDFTEDVEYIKDLRDFR